MASSSVLHAFTQISESLEARSKIRDELRVAVKEMAMIVRKMQASLHGLHINPAPEAMTRIGAEVMGLSKEFASHVGSLVPLIPPGEHYRYCDMWRNQIEQFVSSVALAQWLLTRELVSFENVVKLLNPAERGNSGNLAIDLENYLVGVCSLPSELTRLCVNCVTNGDYSLPSEIAKFVSELYSAFELLNFKNDVLRRRFDSIKYDLKKIEEVVYDIRIRQLHAASQ
eukprot:GFYU01007120.1.p1 GENE.GFYU01007120.1~~GFYU01007120.1.p1  ORF type:complete len:227 (-),score=32.23 GFYU01007120.1:52-732(-)